jgi:hypothetical protein
VFNIVSIFREGALSTAARAGRMPRQRARAAVGNAVLEAVPPWPMGSMHASLAENVPIDRNRLARIAQVRRKRLG